ncbi:PTS ascorbate transporter subunit IIC [Deinococcus sp. Arct2-2]|uniref:PTS ascorbate transporter subunit IIC n=1 Tax=Deinococcus sp. Arct2-2 TaxID=2568653 RepID=UPI0010A2ECA5|nr:PTS ascorbate transporter subunit IIC [Deinococcus sp. Arct2-2]THF71722.1 PTS ascorbate transporter subunit IIC [Deinococcus sp. Arct2-2]
MARKNYPLRISPELYAALERWAADDLRSVNAQIEFLLTQSVKKAGRMGQTLKAAAESPSSLENPEQ